MHSLPRALATVLVTAGLALAVLAGPARAQAAEQLLDYRVDLQIEADGALVVTEQIAYDFGTEERHGIFRDVPVRFRYDDRHDRVYPLEVLEVSGSPRTPVQYALEDVDNTLRIRIGDPDQTITDQHDYAITYRVEGTLNGFPDHDELYWNSIGADWEVLIQQASVTVTAPAPIGQVACYAGPVGSTRSCGSSETDGRTASFATTGLGPNEGLTVVVGFPTGVVPAPRPVLEERSSLMRRLARAFSVTPGRLGMAGGVLVVVLLGLGWQFGVAGRDRRTDDPLGSPDETAGRMTRWGRWPAPWRRSRPKGSARPRPGCWWTRSSTRWPSPPPWSTWPSVATCGSRMTPRTTGRSSTGGWSSSSPPTTTCWTTSGSSLMGCSPPAAAGGQRTRRRCGSPS